MCVCVCERERDSHTHLSLYIYTVNKHTLRCARVRENVCVHCIDDRERRVCVCVCETIVTLAHTETWSWAALYVPLLVLLSVSFVLFSGTWIEHCCSGWGHIRCLGCVCVCGPLTRNSVWCWNVYTLHVHACVCRQK